MGWLYSCKRSKGELVAQRLTYCRAELLSEILEAF